MPITKDNSLHYWDNDTIICPHCDNSINAWEYELHYILEDTDRSHFIECPFCEKEMRVSAKITYTFSTNEQP